MNDPFARIIVDILSNLVIILLITDHVIVITGLPNIFPVFFIAISLERTDNPCNSGCPRRDTRPRVSVCGYSCRDTRPRVSACVMDTKQFIRTPREGCPYDLTEDFLSALGADCDEVRAIWSVNNKQGANLGTLLFYASKSPMSLFAVVPLMHRRDESLVHRLPHRLRRICQTSSPEKPHFRYSRSGFVRFRIWPDTVANFALKRIRLSS